MFTLRLNYRLQIYTLLYTRVETTRVTSQHWNTLSDNISALKHEYFFSHPEAALTTSVPLPSEQSSTPQKEPRENSGSGFCSPPPSPHLLREAAPGAAHPPLTLPTIPTRIPRRRGWAGYRPPPHESRLKQPPHLLHARKETPLVSPRPALHSAARLNLTRTACRCTAQSPPRLQRDGAPTAPRQRTAHAREKTPHFRFWAAAADTAWPHPHVTWLEAGPAIGAAGTAALCPAVEDGGWQERGGGERPWRTGSLLRRLVLTVGRRRMTSDTGFSPIARRSRRASWFAASSPSTTGASWCWGWLWRRVSSPLGREVSSRPAGLPAARCRALPLWRVAAAGWGLGSRGVWEFTFRAWFSLCYVACKDLVRYPHACYL